MAVTAAILGMPGQTPGKSMACFTRTIDLAKTGHGILLAVSRVNPDVGANSLITSSPFAQMRYLMSQCAL